jgi:hypothetical protein
MRIAARRLGVAIGVTAVAARERIADRILQVRIALEAELRLNFTTLDWLIFSALASCCEEWSRSRCAFST